MKAYRFKGADEEIIFDGKGFLFENGRDYLVKVEEIPEAYYPVHAVISNGFDVVGIPYSGWDTFHDYWVEMVPESEVRYG